MNTKRTFFLGFDLSIMANDLYDEAIIDVVGPETLLSKAYPIKVSLGFCCYPKRPDHNLGSHTQRYHCTATGFLIVFQTGFHRTTSNKS